MASDNSNKGVRRLLLKRARAAETLDVSISKLKRLERTGKLRPIRVGGGRDVHYDSSEIEALAEEKDHG